MSESHESHAGAAAGFSGFDDGRDDGLDWTQHPTYVNSLLHQEHSGFDDINLPTALYPMSHDCAANPEITSINTWSPQGTLDLSYASLGPTFGSPLNLASFGPPPAPVDARPGGLGNTATWGTGPSNDHSYHHPPALFMPPLPLAPHPKLPKEGWTQAQQDLLISSRQAGRGFPDIAEDMLLQFGVEITPNALVKRFGKIQETHLGPLSTAINNAKPDIMACIKTELDKLGYDALPQADKKALDEIMQDFHRSIPKLVQNRVYRKRKAEQSISSNFGL